MGDGIGVGRSRNVAAYWSASGEAGLGKKNGAAYGSVRIVARLLFRSFTTSFSLPFLVPFPCLQSFFSFTLSFPNTPSFSVARGLKSSESRRRGSEMNDVRSERILVV